MAGQKGGRKQGDDNTHWQDNMKGPSGASHYTRSLFDDRHLPPSPSPITFTTLTRTGCGTHWRPGECVTAATTAIDTEALAYWQWWCKKASKVLLSVLCACVCSSAANENDNNRNQENKNKYSNNNNNNNHWNGHMAMQSMI